MIIPSEGPNDAAIVFIGRNPGRIEVKLKRPFVGPSGQRLRRGIQGIELVNFKLINLHPIYTENNIEPTLEEVDSTWEIFEMDLRRLSSVRIMVLLGQLVHSYSDRIEVVMSKVQSAWNNQYKIDYYNMIHPSAALRSGSMELVFARQMQLLGLLIKEKKIGST